MKVLVTGVVGFIGRGLCNTLASRGFDLVPLVRGALVGVEIAVGDSGQETDWLGALAKQLEVVAHLAARVHVMKDDEAYRMESYWITCPYIGLYHSNIHEKNKPHIENTQYSFDDFTLQVKS